MNRFVGGLEVMKADPVRTSVGEKKHQARESI